MVVVRLQRLGGLVIPAGEEQRQRDVGNGKFGWGSNEGGPDRGRVFGDCGWLRRRDGAGGGEPSTSVGVHSGCDWVEHNIQGGAGGRDNTGGSEDRRWRRGEAQGFQDPGGDCVTINDGSFIKTRNGVRVKTWPGGSGYARKIMFEQVKLLEAQNPIIIDQYYCDGVTNFRNETTTYKESDVGVKDVTYSGFEGTSTDVEAILLKCSSNMPCKNIVMDQIRITSVIPGKQVCAVCENAKACSPVFEAQFFGHRVSDVETIKDLIEKGSAIRSTGTIRANVESSCSHAMLQLVIKRSVEGSELKPPCGVGKLSFIDLDGSVRGADTTDNNKHTRYIQFFDTKWRELRSIKVCLH